MPIQFQDVIEPGDGLEERLNVRDVGFVAQRSCKVLWEERWAFIGENLLKPWPYVGVAAWCVEAKVKPFPESRTVPVENGLSKAEYALVTLFYTSNVFELKTGVIGWERLRGVIDTFPVRIKEDTFRWSSGDYVETGDAPSYVSFPGMLYERGYVGLPGIPMAAVTLLGCVNATPIACPTLGVVFAAETVRYADFSCERRMMPSGAEAWSLVYYHHYRPNIDAGGVARGWNYFWNPNTCNFESIDFPRPPYPLANLGLLYP